MRRPQFSVVLDHSLLAEVDKRGVRGPVVTRILRRYFALLEQTARVSDSLSVPKINALEERNLIQLILIDAEMDKTEQAAYARRLEAQARRAVYE